MGWFFVVLLVAAVFAGLVVVGRRRGPGRDPELDSGVQSFRRHMDALSPQARRAVIDRVRAAQERDTTAEG